MRLPWRRGRAPDDDPYWDAFINRPPADPNNLIPHAFRAVKEGGVNPARTEVHSPNVMTRHVKELGRFYGADRVGIVERPGLDPPFAIVCLLKADYDPRTARGIGGQVPALKAMFATSTLAAYIRELGYRADCVELPEADDLARAAGLLPLPVVVPSAGRATGAFALGAARALSRGEGWPWRWRRPKACHAHVADVILTDLPLEPDGRAA